MPTRRPLVPSALAVFVAVVALATFAQDPPTEVKVKASDGGANESFGDSIAVDGNLMAVGAPMHDSGQNESGAVYLFRKNGSVWSEEAKLVPGDPREFGRMGWSVALSGDTVVAGAPSGGLAGAAYVFVPDGAGWKQAKKLEPGDGEVADRFGRAVAVDGDTIVVGAPEDDDTEDGSGSVYVYRKDGDSWTQEDKLNADVPVKYEEMGFSVAVEGDTVVAGAHYNNEYDNWTGAAYVFERSGTDWIQAATLYAEDPGRGNQFGWSVAVSGDTAVVGAVFQGSGSAYVYRRAPTWSFEQKLPRVGIGPDASFGHSVAVRGDVAVVGAPGDDSPGAPGAGTAWVYLRDGTTWTHHQTVSASDVTAGKQFGVWIDIDRVTLAVGAPGDGELGTYAGAAYAYQGAFPAPGNDACLLPKKVKVGTKGLVAAGTLHLGPDDVDLTLPLTVEVGATEYPLPGLEAVKGGKSYVHTGEDVVLVVKPTKFGSSRAKFKLRAAAQPADGQVVLRLVSADLDAGCTVTLASGRFKLGKGDLAAPALAPEKMKAKIVGDSKDGLKVTARLAGMPAAATDVTVAFAGYTIAATAAEFQTKGSRHAYRGEGVAILIDAAKGQVKVTLKGVDLGTFPEGASSVDLTLTLGAEEHTIAIRVFRKKGLKY